MLQTVNKVKRQINPKLRIEGILLTTVDSRTNYVLCLFYHVLGRPQVVLGTSFTAGDKDILGADEDYTALENDLRRQVDNIEFTHPEYDEYRYSLDEIGHNPYELTSYLTVTFL